MQCDLYFFVYTLFCSNLSDWLLFCHAMVLYLLDRIKACVVFLQLPGEESSLETFLDNPRVFKITVSVDALNYVQLIETII